MHADEEDGGVNGGGAGVGGGRRRRARSGGCTVMWSITGSFFPFCLFFPSFKRFIWVLGWIKDGWRLELGSWDYLFHFCICEQSPGKDLCWCFLLHHDGLQNILHSRMQILSHTLLPCVTRVSSTLSFLVECPVEKSKRGQSRNKASESLLDE